MKASSHMRAAIFAIGGTAEATLQAAEEERKRVNEDSIGERTCTLRKPLGISWEHDVANSGLQRLMVPSTSLHARPYSWCAKQLPC